MFRAMLLLASALPLSAQQAREEPNDILVVTVFAGFTTGGELWSVPNQPVNLINSDLTTVGRDTFAVRRSAGTGIVVGMAGTLYRTNNLGIGAEVVYTGPAEENECRIVFSGTPSAGSGEARGYNDDLCAAIDDDNDVLGSISFLAEISLRGSGSASVTPFARLGIGVTDLGRSSAEMSGRFFGPDVNGDGLGDFIDRAVMLDRETSTAGLTFGGGLGVLIRASRSYSVRIEVRDQMFHRAVATGPADRLSAAQVDRVWFHHPAIVVGFGFRMQRRGGRGRSGT